MHPDKVMERDLKRKEYWGYVLIWRQVKLILIYFLGTLSFALNGENMGVAFQSPALTKGPVFAAVALLHCAGCVLTTGKPVPPYMLNWKTLYWSNLSKFIFIWNFICCV
jgi:hypothetical protein